jgi:hypothetical protein
MAVSQPLDPGGWGRACELTQSVQLRGPTMEYLEKVRSQFLSLRQLGRSYSFSGITCWQLSPVTASISNLRSELPVGRVSSLFSERLVLSDALDFIDPVRFSKSKRFELLMRFNGKRFCGNLGQARASGSNSPSRGSNRPAGARPSGPQRTSPIRWPAIGRPRKLPWSFPRDN